MFSWTSIKTTLTGLLAMPEELPSPERYTLFRRRIIALMLVITVAPLLLMTTISYYEYNVLLKTEGRQPLRILINKTKHSFELFLAGRVSALRFIASAYSYEQLSDCKNLNRVFRVLSQEFKGFVDLGLINSKGEQVVYVGPYDLHGKNYAQQGWFEQVMVSGVYISDVFMGYRKFPHIVIAVKHSTDTGESWIVRATIDTERFNDLISSMGLDAYSDAFLINRDGILQTVSKFYGPVLANYEFVPPLSYEPNVIERRDSLGREVTIGYVYLDRTDFILMLVKPSSQVFKAWQAMKVDILLLFFFGVAAIMAVVFKLTHVMVGGMRESDEKRELAFREMQHTHKLSSIGRLAAGVAHEVNNPLAVINEKAGLVRDLIEFKKDFPDKEKFLSLVAAIIQSVQRCRTITHRLLGFARRMDVEIQTLDLNEIVREVLGFLEKEALHRNIKLILELHDALPKIASDRGQLQQVFLNILNNAFQAVDDGGFVAVRSWDRGDGFVTVTIKDNGYGMSEETMKHIFEPFFTTKEQGKGTGLGLSITYGIVKKLGGEIDVQSKPGQGTTFTVALPKKSGEESGN